MARLSLFNSPLLLGFDHFERALDRVSKVSSDGYPPYNIEQVDDNALRITLAVAGFAMSDLSLTIEDGAWVRIGAVIVPGVTIGRGAVVAAGAVVSPNTHVPARRMALGIPARVREGHEVPEDAYRYAVESYVARGKRFRAELRRLEV